MKDLSKLSVRELIVLVEHPEEGDSSVAAEVEAELMKRELHWNEIAGYAKVFWKDYLVGHMRSILENNEAVSSYFIAHEDFVQLFQEAFNEYRLRKKDMGIDDHKKYWAP